jgi:hypothetical protein
VWLAGLLVDHAARQRSAAHWERRAAEAEASLAGALADLAERSAPVSLELAPGRWRHGRVGAVGPDWCVVGTGPTSSLVALDAVATVRTGPGEAPALGAAGPPTRATGPSQSAPATLRDLLDGLVGSGAAVLVWGRHVARPQRGELVSVGQDLAVLALDGGAGTAYVALASLAEVSLAVSG